MATKEGDPRPPWATRVVQTPGNFVRWLFRKVLNAVFSIVGLLKWICTMNYVASESSWNFLTKDVPRAIVTTPFHLSTYVFLIEFVIAVGAISVTGGVAAFAAGAKDFFVMPLFILSLVWASLTMWIIWSSNISHFREGLMPMIVAGIVTYAFEFRASESAIQAFTGFALWSFLLFHLCGTVFCTTVRWYHARDAKKPKAPRVVR